MKISVCGKNFNVGQSLTSYVEDSVTKRTTKYFSNPINASITFKKQNYFYEVDIIVDEGVKSGILIKSNAQANEVHSAFDLALMRIEKQLQRYSNKLKRYKLAKDRNASDIIHGRKYVINYQYSEDNIIVQDKIPENTIETEELSEDNPTIIVDKQTNIEPLSVSEAVMKMDLADLPALVFTNSKTNKLNFIYYRKDGNISWIDPS